MPTRPPAETNEPATVDQPSLRERKRAAAKAKVVDVAIALFEQRG